MFNNLLLEIKKDLSMHHNEPEDVLSRCIQKRLNKSLETYIESLDISYDYLYDKNDLNIMRKLIKKG